MNVNDTLRAGTLLAGFCCGLAPWTTLRAQTLTGDPIVELPAFVVTGDRPLPPPEQWRYAQIPGFEILSDLSDAYTTRLLRDFEQFRLVVGALWPELQPPGSAAVVNRGEGAFGALWSAQASPGFRPASLILCGRGGKFDAFIPKTGASAVRGKGSILVQDAEQFAMIIDAETPAVAIENNQERAFDALKQLRHEYLRFLMQQLTPPPPAWLEEGIAQLFAAAEYDQKTITFAKMEKFAPPLSQGATTGEGGAPSLTQGALALLPKIGAAAEDPEAITSLSDPDPDRGFNSELYGAALIPLGRFFAIERGSPQAGQRWSKQAYAMVHFCLYGEKKRHRNALLKFLNRTGQGPATEAVFKECFGETYDQFLRDLRGYTEFAAYEYIQLRTKGREAIPYPEPPPLRDATPSEIGRIKGEALRMNHQLDAARTEFIAPYVRGARDPALLASIGLFELAKGQNERARKFLEAATAGQTRRARAYLELARLRYADALKAPGEGEGLLDAAQAAGVLRPLLAVRTLPLPPAEAYELIAEVWSHCTVIPDRDDLVVLDEGVGYFPQRTRLVCQAAELNVRHGFTEEARKLIEAGLKSAVTPEAQNDLKRLRDTLAIRPAP